jgi:hypothetical protein
MRSLLIAALALASLAALALPADAAEAGVCTLTPFGEACLVRAGPAGPAPLGQCVKTPTIPYAFVCA